MCVLHLRPLAVGEAVAELMRDKDEWGPGRYGELLVELKEKAAEALRIDVKAKGLFPSRPSSLGQQLNKVKTTLRELGILVEVTTDSSTNTRLVSIRKSMEKSSGSSGAPSRDTVKQEPPDDLSSSGGGQAFDTVTREPEDKPFSRSTPKNSRDGRTEDADDLSGSPRRQNLESPMDDNLALVEVFRSVFRGLSDPDGRVSHYDLVTKLINSQKFGRGGPLAMINSMLEAGMIERLPGGYYSEVRKGLSERI